ncbi:hypothetical protein AGLY_017309 [Aphis glycines]|uniref:Uncharacterized protein n=1 Tax=Aphis glycines TaxID=307491 RepID=A0A6G0SVW4_APHGL|nr:hypothetical protein AGLY_017309 [Aphis glycines]
MAGSIRNMEEIYKKKKNFTYVPPTPPAELIDCSNFILDFTGRKFLNVGLDSEDKFNIIVQIITPSRYVNMPSDFLRRIFSLMGNILSFVLDVPQKYKRNLFLETDNISLSSMVYQGENMLVIESKTVNGCRVLLNRTDLIKLQYLEWSIVETVIRKTNIIRPLVLKQFEIIGNYIDREFTNVQLPPKTIEEMIIFIKNLKAEHIIKNVDLNFASQLKMFAAPKLAEQRLRWSREISPELFVDPISSLSPAIIPKKYSSPSPQYNDDNDAQPAPRQSFSPSFFDGECSQINPTQATWAPTKPKPIDDSESLPPAIIDNHSTGHDSDNFTQTPLWYNNRVRPPPTSLAVDENDGPTSFNHSPSILDSKPTKKRSAKRKLFFE